MEKKFVDMTVGTKVVQKVLSLPQKKLEKQCCCFFFTIAQYSDP